MYVYMYIYNIRLNVARKAHSNLLFHTIRSRSNGARHLIENMHLQVSSYYFIFFSIPYAIFMRGMLNAKIYEYYICIQLVNVDLQII